MERVMVTGANRGIGFEIARQCIAKGDLVIATYRDRDRSRTLLELADRLSDRLNVVQLDVRNAESIERCYQRVSAMGKGLDVLFNNAGVGADSMGMGDPVSHNALGKLDAESMLKMFHVNSISPMIVTQRFLPLLEKGSDPKVVHISSQMGSIERRDAGGCYSYCGSKAALNMLAHVLAHDIRHMGITSVVIHPGWVRTYMGGPEAPVHVQDSVRGILKVVDGLKHKDAGRFLDHQGEEVPW